MHVWKSPLVNHGSPFENNQEDLKRSVCCSLENDLMTVMCHLLQKKSLATSDVSTGIVPFFKNHDNLSYYRTVLIIQTVTREDLT